MHISGIENDILNQAKQNEIQNNNIEIFEVPGQTEKPRCPNPYTSLKRLLYKCLKYIKLV